LLAPAKLVIEGLQKCVNHFSNFVRQTFGFMQQVGIPEAKSARDFQLCLQLTV